MNAEQLLEFLEQHIEELPHLMGEEAWQAFQADRATHKRATDARGNLARRAGASAVQPLFKHLNRCPQVREKLLRVQRKPAPTTQPATCPDPYE
jgi:hypothetical protein